MVQRMQLICMNRILCIKMNFFRAPFLLIWIAMFEINVARISCKLISQDLNFNFQYVLELERPRPQSYHVGSLVSMIINFILYISNFSVILVTIHYGKTSKVKIICTCKLLLTSTILLTEFRLSKSKAPITHVQQKKNCKNKQYQQQQIVSCRKCVNVCPINTMLIGCDENKN